MKYSREHMVKNFETAMSVVPGVDESLRAGIVNVFETWLEEWEDDIVDRLSGRIRDWELIMDGQLDGSLYTLGLRQAVDVVRGADPDPWVVKPLDTDDPVE